MLWFFLSFLFLSISGTSTKADGGRETFLWYHHELVDMSLEEVVSFAKARSITCLAIYPSYNFDDSNVTYIQNNDLKAFAIYVTAGASYNRSDYNFTEPLTNIKNETSNYDGVILDDTQNLWLYAHQQGINDLNNYQAFMDNVTDILIPEFGSDNLIVEMAIYSNHVNYTKMTQVNASLITFSYYYPPDPIIRYFDSINYHNTSASAWNIKAWYDSYGLNEYHAYEGWFWFHGMYATDRLSTTTIISTYTGISTLIANYNVKHLHFWCLSSIEGSFNVTGPDETNFPRFKNIVNVLASNFLNSQTPTRNSLEETTLQNYYWEDEFTSIENETEETYLGWLITRQNSGFYSTANATGNGTLYVGFSGSNTGYSGQYLYRSTRTCEYGLHVEVKVIPTSNLAWDVIGLRSGYPYYHAYYFQFSYGISQSLKFFYFNNTGVSIEVNIAKYTLNSPYIVEYDVTETMFQCSIRNSTWSWNQTLSGSALKYNSLKIYDIFLKQRIGTYSGTIEIGEFDYALMGNTLGFPITFLFPIMFMFGMIGLGSIFAGLLYGIHKYKHGEYYDAFYYALLLGAIGIGLFMAWLWH